MGGFLGGREWEEMGRKIGLDVGFEVGGAGLGWILVFRMYSLLLLRRILVILCLALAIKKFVLLGEEIS